MNTFDTARLTIASSIRECDSHISRIHRAVKLLASSFPLSAVSLESADDQLVEHVDQFVYRFVKLQDSMGRRLFPSLYTVLENDDAPLPFLDMLNRLEKLEVVTSVADWQFFRNLRNNLAHDYPESIEQTAQTLNALFSEWQKIEQLYLGAKLYYLERNAS